MIARRLLTAAAAVAAACWLPGCGGGPVRVSGQVVYDDGQPVTELARGGVLFNSEDGKNASTGDIDADGRFILSYRHKHDGAIPGAYKVAIQPYASGAEAESARRRYPIPVEYTDAETTPLKVNIEGRTDDLKLTVPRRVKDKK